MADTYVGEDNTIMAVRNAIADAELKRRKLMQGRLGADQNMREKPANFVNPKGAEGPRKIEVPIMSPNLGSAESVFPTLLQLMMSRK